MLTMYVHLDSKLNTIVLVSSSKTVHDYIAAGTCITSDDTVIRDLLYNGNPIHEKVTVISRIAPTFIRYAV